jgi:uncharacterized protein YyaL (SSP411 family)
MRRFLYGIMCFLLITPQLTYASEFRFSPRPNKAHLIQWRSWDARSFEEALKEKRPILLSLSAVWCHWCHVMDETTYSDGEVIAYINENYIPIRVDSDMRPDIDSLYNQGGWPSTVFLLPDGEVIDGDTYISPEKMLERLARIKEFFSQERPKLESALNELREKRSKQRKEEPSDPDHHDVLNIMRILKTSFDKKHGGFGSWQKFPNPDAIDFLLSSYPEQKDRDVKEIIILTLNSMEKGDIYDDVEGGFFRYATKPDWSEPHYEKMLDINAGLIKNYASASMVFNRKNYRKTLNKTIKYAQENLLDQKTNAFFGSQDADEEYYARKKRTGLKKPFIDNTVYADLNALMITALAHAYAATGNKEYRTMAVKAADFILTKMYADDTGVYHYFRNGKKNLSGLVSDNVLFGLALIDLYNVTGNGAYIKKVEEIARLMKRFYDDKKSIFRASLDTTLIRPTATGRLTDFKHTVSNYRAIILLNRLYYLTGDKKLKDTAGDILAHYGKTYERLSVSSGLYGSAIRWSSQDAVNIKIIGYESKSGRFLSKISSLYIPEKVINMLSLERDQLKITALGFPLKEAVYVCHGKRCSAPVENPDQVIEEVKRFLKSGGTG